MTSAPRDLPRGYLRPGQWGPIVGFLAVVVVALSALLLLGVGGDSKFQIVQDDTTVRATMGVVDIDATNVIVVGTPTPLIVS